MLFTISKSKNLPIELFQADYFKTTAINISLYKLNVFDLKLDEYLRNNYNMSLKTICNKILDNLIISNPTSTEVTFVLRDTKLDNLYKLITYGSINTQRSNIIKNVFIKMYDTI